MKCKPVLVVLAAGMGSRYGGLKQMDSIGASGEALLDYSVFDALRSGFGKIVFVIRGDIEKDFKNIVLARMGDAVPYELVFQEQESLVPARVVEMAKKVGRTKPWGTAHAVLCAEQAVKAPFAVINADDFYGRDAYVKMADFLSDTQLREGAIVPYRLGNTLSPTGSVTRGVCRIENGKLLSVKEHFKIEKEGDVIFSTGKDGTKLELAADTPVSMNFWGFPSRVFELLESYFDSFLETEGIRADNECYIPEAVDSLIRSGAVSFRVLDADSEWFGVTYAADRAAAASRILALTASGVYPATLWPKPGP
jgi:UTP-glucose-1-phosphate uridylyltransferase